jgi:hypothetical protein
MTFLTFFVLHLDNNQTIILIFTYVISYTTKVIFVIKGYISFIVY